MVVKEASLTTQELRNAILGGSLAKDGRLMSERVLAQTLQVTRSRLRGVLDDLAREGLVFRRHGQGTFLQPPPAQAPSRLDGLARRVSPAALMEVRLELEPALAALAAERGSASDKARLLRLMEDTLIAPDLQSYERADDIFHYKIAEMAGNEVFLTLFEEIRSLRQAKDWTEARQAKLGEENMTAVSTQHSAIANAICAGSTSAARTAMYEHMQQVRSVVLTETP
ncbi:FadR/GntR family transcriptional regulator [Phaeobacter sp. HF9A]|uniref:FadR/GntR family transcriptional regulator n=1 Tax=Phaeobacter sp. HF9A TaxID=2721561 RepID=UPI00142F849F|nr:FCD domain-containing protein [Phaeobacter sp. HF9A]NIZ12765.1 FadR family transcriptional regulator [Phaeobacter sp. HF9A]